MISLATTIETVTERPKEGPLKSGNCEFTYSEVVGITNNFNRPIGRGGFGEVYLGTLADDTQVAVKVHSPSSNQGPKAFRAEVRQSNPSMALHYYKFSIWCQDTKKFEILQAKLLTRVHHKNLVRLIGYCDDSTNMVLIYEYMSNGNLQQKLSGIYIYICIDHSWSQVYNFNWKLLVDFNVYAFSVAREAADVLNWKQRLQIAVDAAHGQ